MNYNNTLLRRTAVSIVMTQPLFFVGCSADSQPQTPPNIVVVLCDDLGYGDLSCFGHEIIETPNLDKLASEGIKLTNFYSAAAVSSPSRAGLLTGRNPNRAGIYDFIPGPKKSEDCRDIVHLQEFETTIPQLLKGAGYSTCLTGKWHCTSRFNTDIQPQPDHFGFDHWFATGNNSAPTHQNPTNFVRNGEAVGELEGFSCEVVVNEALAWLDGQAQSENPFYLHVTFHEPHEPIASPQDLVDKHMAHSANVHEAEYYANVENMDRHLGRLLDYIREHHGDNTLVVFSADNGPETLNRYSRAFRSYGSTGGLAGRKLWTSEGGIHVCGIMNWFGRDTFNGETDAVLSSLDYLPTFCELTGVELPQRDLDGESFVELFESGKFERDGALLWVFYNPENEQAVAMRYGDWKIMCNLSSEGEVLPKIFNIYEGNYELVKNVEMTDFTLFNLREDRDETTDLSESNPEMLEQMKVKLRAEYDRLVEGSHVWVRK